ncbi:MAG TPA: hypothetical protein VJC37_09350 [Planctomycetota bacterium]|nr:hypothetical protein [Planctomycetota bacterium]
MLGIILFVVLFAVVLGIILASLKSVQELKEDKSRVVSKETLVTVGQYINMIDAQSAQMRLESEDIETYMDDDNFIMLGPLYSPASGGVKIQVKSSDVGKALEILGAKPEITEDPAEKYQGDGDPCPQCGSHSTYPYKGLSGSIISFVIVSLVTSIAPVLMRKLMYCFDCKHKWKAPIRKKLDKDSKDEWQKRMDKVLKAENKHWK